MSNSYKVIQVAHISPTDEQFEHLICLICELVVLDPIECKTCEKLFCAKCVHEWLKKSKNCPNPYCKTYKEGSVNMSLIKWIDLNCCFYVNGCKERIKYEKYFEHIKNCQHACFECTAEGCNYKGNIEKIENHIIECELKVIKCRFCSIQTIKKNLPNHEKLCGKMEINCNICKNSVEKMNFYFHNDGKCLENLNNSFIEHKCKKNLT